MTETISRAGRDKAEALLRVAAYLSRPQKFMAVAEARSEMRRTLELAEEGSVVLTTHGEPEAALVPFAMLEDMRRALLHLLVAEMEQSVTRLQSATRHDEAVPETSEAELESLVGEALREARGQQENEKAHDSVSEVEGAEALRVVVDAQLVWAMFLVRRDRPQWRSSKRQLLGLLTNSRFRWLWSPDILADYERGAQAVETNEGIAKRAVFDGAGFTLLLAALQLAPPVAVSVSTMRAARRRLAQATRTAERDLDDAVYLACAVDEDAHLLTTEDSDLHSLGNEYQGVPIVNWNNLKSELRARGLVFNAT